MDIFDIFHIRTAPSKVSRCLFSYRTYTIVGISKQHDSYGPRVYVVAMFSGKDMAMKTLSEFKKEYLDFVFYCVRKVRPYMFVEENGGSRRIKNFTELLDNKS